MWGVPGPILRRYLQVVTGARPHILASANARAKTDRLDARTLAKLRASGELDAVWIADDDAWEMRRRLSRRGQLVRARTRAMNQIHGVLMRRLLGRPPVSDLFGVEGWRWIASSALPVEERESVDSAMRRWRSWTPRSLRSSV
jgi:transposase